MKSRLLLQLTLLVAISSCDKKSTSAPNTPQPEDTAALEIQTTVLAQNLSHPWEILWGPDNFIWMTERGGRVSRVHPESGALTPVLQVPDVVSLGEGGLLGMVLHPDFTASPFVYLVYNYYESGTYYREKIVRYRYNGTTLTDPFVLLAGIDAYQIHNGSRLVILDGKLFITTGDAGGTYLAPDPARLNGKILRINLDGSIPSDNPYPNSPVWSRAHRNPQGLVAVGQKLFSSEHGPDTDDEINQIVKGGHYGWPDVKGVCNTDVEQSFCQANSVREPLKTWTPTAAVAGLDYYSSALIPQWKNSLLVTALKNARLYVMKFNAAQTDIIGTEEFFTNTYGRLRDLCISPSGKIFICTSNGSNDKVIAVSPL